MVGVGGCSSESDARSSHKAECPHDAMRSWSGGGRSIYSVTLRALALRSTLGRLGTSVRVGPCAAGWCSVAESSCRVSRERWARMRAPGVVGRIGRVASEHKRWPLPNRRGVADAPLVRLDAGQGQGSRRIHARFGVSWCDHAILWCNWVTSRACSAMCRSRVVDVPASGVEGQAHRSSELAVRRTMRAVRSLCDNDGRAVAEITPSNLVIHGFSARA